MTKNNIIWLGILSLIGALLIWLFHGAIFSRCSAQTFGFTHYPVLWGPITDCQIYTLIITFAGLFLGPLLITLLFFSGYVLIFNRGMQNSNFFLWFFWIVSVYLFASQFYYPPNI